MKDEKKSKEQLSKEINDLRTLNRELGIQKKELLKSNQFLENVFQTSGDGILVIDDKGCIIRANKSMENILDYPYADIVGKYTFDFASFDEESVKKSKRMLEELYEKGFVKNFESHFQKKDGTLVPTEINITKLLDKQGNYIGAVSSLRNISERKKTEMRLQESEEKYRELVENANNVIIRWLPDGTITFFNEFAQKFFGFDASEIIGKKAIGSIVPETESTGRDLKQMVSGILKNPAKYEQNENENICKDGKRVWVHWTNRAVSDKKGNVIEVLSVGTDINDRKRAEEELIRLSTAIEQVGDTIIKFGIDGIVQYVNPALEKQLQYNRDELIGKDFANLSKGHLKEKNYKKVWETINKGESWSGNIIETRKDGSQFTANVNISPVFDDTGKIICFTSIGRDITKEQQMEQQLRQSQKMEAMGTLAGGIAHDFNNILAGILGYTELAQDDAAQDSPVQESLAWILKSTMRARDLVKQILTFSRISHEERKPVLLNSIINEATKLLRSTIPTTIEIKKNIDDTTGMVNADPTQMHQIVMNLCTNAFHAMQETGGVLDITLSSIVISHESIRKYHNISPGPFLELRISDTGTGIDSKIIHQIFDPFYTTKDKEKGTGMGLAVVHGIVKDHGGDISIDSQLGKGTIFSIVLPQVIEEPDKEEDSSSKVPTGTEHILFIDDEKTLMDLWKRILESLGYTVTAKNSSIEALETFQQAPNAFDMVITDQTMPHLTGYDLAKQILGIKPSANIILCTGYSETVTPEKTETAGIKALIYKPIGKKEIAQKIREVLDKHNHL